VNESKELKPDLEKRIEILILKNNICKYYEEGRFRNFLVFLSEIYLGSNCLK
jgi:hypothetical protein